MDTPLEALQEDFIKDIQKFFVKTVKELNTLYPDEGKFKVTALTEKKSSAVLELGDGSNLEFIMSVSKKDPQTDASLGPERYGISFTIRRLDKKGKVLSEGYFLPYDNRVIHIETYADKRFKEQIQKSLFNEILGKMKEFRVTLLQGWQENFDRDLSQIFKELVDKLNKEFSEVLTFQATTTKQDIKISVIPPKRQYLAHQDDPLWKIRDYFENMKGYWLTLHSIPGGEVMDRQRLPANADNIHIICSLDRGTGPSSGPLKRHKDIVIHLPYNPRELNDAKKQIEDVCSSQIKELLEQIENPERARKKGNFY